MDINRDPDSARIAVPVVRRNLHESALGPEWSAPGPIDLLA